MKAINIAMWAENQAHKAFDGTAFEDKTTKDAKYLLGKLRENKQAIWAKNDILQKCRALNAAKIGEALELLDEMKCIRLIEERTKTKTKLTIRVNPLITGK